MSRFLIYAIGPVLTSIFFVALFFTLHKRAGDFYKKEMITAPLWPSYNVLGLIGIFLMMLGAFTAVFASFLTVVFVQMIGLAFLMFSIIAFILSLIYYDWDTAIEFELPYLLVYIFFGICLCQILLCLFVIGAFG